MLQGRPEAFDLQSNWPPIIGRVAAGAPLLAQEHIEDYCDLSASFFAPPAHYLLQVCGDSMINVGIFDGDLLAVHSTTDVKEGQIAVVRIEDEVTVKRWKRVSDTRVDLVAENDDYAQSRSISARKKFLWKALASEFYDAKLTRVLNEVCAVRLSQRPRHFPSRPQTFQPS